MSIKPILKSILKFGKKHLPKILAGGAIATEIAGMWMVHKKAPEVHEKLNELSEDATAMDKIKVAAPLYLPAALMVVASSSCIIGSVALGEARVAAMTELAMASQATLSRYEQKVIDTMGKDKAMELQNDIAKDLMKERPATQQTIIPTGHGTDVFYDPLSGRYFESSETWINNAAREMQNRINCGPSMSAEVNEWYDELDIDEVGLGMGKQWDIDHKFAIEIGSWEDMPNGRPCRPILYLQNPVLYNGKEYMRE